MYVFWKYGPPHMTFVIFMICILNLYYNTLNFMLVILILFQFLFHLGGTFSPGGNYSQVQTFTPGWTIFSLRGGNYFPRVESVFTGWKLFSPGCKLFTGTPRCKHLHLGGNYLHPCGNYLHLGGNYWVKIISAQVKIVSSRV